MPSSTRRFSLEFFELHGRALRRFRRISGHRRHVDLDRALGIGVAFTNLLHALRPKLNNPYQSGRGMQQMDCLAQG